MNFRNLLDRPTRLFWVLHVGFWLFWGVFLKYLWTTEISESNIPNYLPYVTVITIIAMVISLALRYLYRWVLNKPIWAQALGFIAGTVITAWAWMEARSYIFVAYVESEEKMGAWMESLGEAAGVYTSLAFKDTFGSSWTMMAAWSVLYLGVKYYRVFQDVSESALKSASMAHEAQLKMLRYQLNPHFLFNTLNAISTLILEQHTELANRMVTKLSNFLRFSLDNDPLQKITLEQELEAIGLYLDIEKVRFEERLRLEQDIEPEALRALIPSLLLQPLVENAIKYGIARAEEGGTLCIAARVFAGELLLELTDDGPGCELVDGRIPGASGVGLRNTEERLSELYGDQHSYRLSKTEPHGLTIRIRIPFESRG
jgi:signal transduction histidine kinase